MTRYILSGGYTYKAADGGRAFCEEMVKGIADPVKILYCPFAEPSEKWPEKFAKDRTFFANNLPSHQLDIKMALSDNFVDQIKWADVVYFRGGRTYRLMEQLYQIKGWKEELLGKTIVGSSAGANMISQYCYSPTDLKIAKGMGLLPIKCLPHYQSDFNAPNVDWDKAYQELDNLGEKLEMVVLREGEYKVIETD